MTQPVEEPASSRTAIPRSSGLAGQTFLVGEHVYVRAVEASDASLGMSWQRGPFPHSTSWFETWIKEGMVKNRRGSTFVVVRKADDVPVGGISTGWYERVLYVTPTVDPLHGACGQAWLAEALRMVIPWLSEEQHRVVVQITVDATQERVIAAMTEAGARFAVRNREQFRTWGGRADGLVFEALNAQWLQTLGDPSSIELPRSGSGEPRPVPGPVTLDGYPPRNAVRVGNRVYLRPLENDDAAKIALWSRRDPDPDWDAGRGMFTTPGYAKGEVRSQKEDPQTKVRFAVCLRENDELIGSLGLDGVDYVHGFAETESAIFRPEYRARGFGTEAKHLLFDYAFNTLNLHSLQSLVIFPNPRSAAALRRQGYREAGRLHWAFASFSAFENFICFDLLASDWRQMPRADLSAVAEEPGP